MLKKGDTIRASSAEELVDISTELERQGYTTDFLYEKDGVKGKWCLIVECPKQAHVSCRRGVKNG